MMRRNNEASERHAERRRREDEAPRLAATVPNLLTLKLHLQEAKGDVSVAETGHKDIAAILEKTLKEEYAADDKLTQLAESRLNKEAA